MSRRVRVSRGTQGHVARDMSRRLKGVVTNYRFGIISLERARELGRRIINDEFKTALRVGRDYVQVAIRRTVELPPEERRRLEKWRDEYVKDFHSILSDVGRS